MKETPKKQETSIFTKMSMLANEYKAINLAQGFPNFPIDPKLIENIRASVEKNTHQYAPYQGLPSLRESISSLLLRHSKVDVSPENVLVTAGATQAIFTIIQAHVKRNDEVILLDPCYDCYETPILLVGALPVHVPLQEDFTPNWDLIFEKTTSKTKMIVINSPHNPSGKVWDVDSFERLIELTQKHPELLVLSDEVYEYLSYEKPHLSVRCFPELQDRAFVVSSFGKSLQATGWKIGYVTASTDLLKAVLNIHQYLVFSVNSFLQDAIANYLPQYNPSDTQRLYQTKRDLFAMELSNSRFSLLPCEGTYFQTVSYAGISSRSDVDFCDWMVQEHGIAAIPLSVFYQNKTDRNHIRLCFAKDDHTLVNALEKLCKI
ncbi:MAG: aminotransferase class I/II-fold pyridoxal phosphate-dependent enzyme [Flavobacteriia bacterium]|nr:aminotransferase class I/II-fold pyridoxal phosphate-dependent enzyme [Flavobacteriia bacterium]